MSWIGDHARELYDDVLTWPAEDSTVTGDDAPPTHKPRVHMHHNGLYVSVGFDDTQDTILKVGGHEGIGGEGDIAHAREWVAAVRLALGQEPQDA